MLLKALEVSINIRPHLFSLLSSTRSLTACIAASTPDQTPAHNWLDPQITSASDRIAKHMVLLIILRRVSPIPIGLIPEDLFKAISRLESKALNIFHGIMVFASWRESPATASLRHSLWAQNRSKMSCQWGALQPPGPDPPWIECAILWMWAPVISTTSRRGIGCHTLAMRWNMYGVEVDVWTSVLAILIFVFLTFAVFHFNQVCWQQYSILGPICNVEGQHHMWWWSLLGDQCYVLEHKLKSWKVGAGSTRTNKAKGA